MANDEKVKSLCGNCLVELRDCQWLLDMRPFPGSRYLTFQDSRDPEHAYDYYCMVECPKHVPDVVAKIHNKCCAVCGEDKNGFQQYYASANEAARQIGGDVGNIVACCRGRRKTHLGLKWRYADGANVTE